MPPRKKTGKKGNKNKGTRGNSQQRAIQTDLFQQEMDERLKFGRPKKKNYNDNDQDIVKESHLKRFYRCRYLYSLIQNQGLKKIPMSALGVMVSFFNARRLTMYGTFDELSRAYDGIIPNTPRVGERLKTFQQMTPEELDKYLPDAIKWFGDGWRGIRSRDEFDGAHLVWPYNENVNNPKTLREMTKAGINYRKFVVENGAPIYGFMNKDFSFTFQGITFKIRFPELRIATFPEHITGFIDDPTIWSFNSHFRFKGKPKLNTSEYVTLRSLGYTKIAQLYPLFRRKCGIEKISPQEIIDPNIVYRHINCNKNIITVTTRDQRERDFVGELMRAVEHFLEARDREDFYPNYSFCSSCPANVVDLEGRLVCQETRGNSSPSVPKFYYDQSRYEVEINGNICDITFSGTVKKRAGVKKPINKLTLSLSYDKVMNNDGIEEDQITVTSDYSSFARGLGYEERILWVMDDELQKIAEDADVKVIHKINFDRDFKFAGQNKIRELLEAMDYEGKGFCGIKAKKEIFRSYEKVYF